MALEVAWLAGCGQQLHTEIDVAAAHAEQLVADWGPDSPEDSLAKTIARSLHGTVPQIAGAGLTTPIAYRWKTQINENASAPAFASELPELDHNEIVGWEGAAEQGRFSAVFLDDCDLHPRVRARIELTLDVIGSQAVTAHRLQSVGQSRVERLVSLVLLGDLVSTYMAVLAGRDPAQIAPIKQLKDALAEQTA